jgi:hypothetical protein
MTIFTAIQTLRDEGVQLALLRREAKRAYAMHQIPRADLLRVLRDCHLLEVERGREA